MDYLTITVFLKYLIKYFIQVLHKSNLREKKPSLPFVEFYYTLAFDIHSQILLLSF